MKKVKLLALVVAAVMIVSLATACGASSNSKPAESTAAPASTAAAPATTAGAPAEAGKYKDGTYKVEYDNFDSKGWKAFVELTIAGDKITAATYDYVNKDGKLKTADAAYEKAMKDKNGVGPVEYSKTLSDGILAKQDAAAVDIVAGATSSSEHFIELATIILKELAPAGTASKVVPLSE